MGKRKAVEEMDDDFVILDMDSSTETKPSLVPIIVPPKLNVDLQPTGKDTNEVLLSVIPPKLPDSNLKHTPCDVVLVIDVSGSMNAEAELPDQTGMDKKESSGLSILDLVKHAAKTIIEKLNKNDRLAIITFSNNAKVIQGLLPMIQAAKAETRKRIQELSASGSTNLWSGIREGLDVFRNIDGTGNVQSVFVLTDGVPNHMCPSQGYVKKLQPMLEKMRAQREITPFISCFGFGYHLNSALLRSIAEVGRGYYAFIPDAGMIGTVFVHAVSNLFSTFAISTEVSLSCSNAKVNITLPSWLEFDTDPQFTNTRTLHLGNIQYGQSRDIIVKLNGALPTDIVKAIVRCNIPNQPEQTVARECSSYNEPTVPQIAIDYHVSRHELCAYLSSLSAKNQNNEHIPLSARKLSTKSDAIDALVQRIESRLAAAAGEGPMSDTTDLADLLSDLQSLDATNGHGCGQIALAIRVDKPAPSPSRDPTYGTQEPSYYQRWGMHYLPSILHAHMRQICTTFKDPGPLRYGANSPLFVKMRDELDDAFDRLPPPKGSLIRSRGGHVTVTMSRYNSYSNPCFAGECQVRMSDGTSYSQIEDLRVGDAVWTRKGSRSVTGIVKTPIDSAGARFQEMVSIASSSNSDDSGDIISCKDGGHEEGLWITPYHPIYPTHRWVFPRDVSTRTQVMKTGSIFSILLEADEDVDAHAIEVGGVICVTLGHGLTHPYYESQPQVQLEALAEHSVKIGSMNSEQACDARAHPFFGSYTKVLTNLSRLDRDEHGRWVSGGIIKGGTDLERGLACDFVKLPRPGRAKEEDMVHKNDSIALVLERQARARQAHL